MKYLVIQKGQATGLHSKYHFKPINKRLSGYFPGFSIAIVLIIICLNLNSINNIKFHESNTFPKPNYQTFSHLYMSKLKSIDSLFFFCLPKKERKKGPAQTPQSFFQPIAMTRFLRFSCFAKSEGVIQTQKILYFNFRCKPPKHLCMALPAFPSQGTGFVFDFIQSGMCHYSPKNNF